MLETNTSIKLPSVLKEPNKKLVTLESKGSQKNLHSKVTNIKKGNTNVTLAGKKIKLPGLNTVSNGFHVSSYSGLKVMPS